MGEYTDLNSEHFKKVLSMYKFPNVELSETDFFTYKRSIEKYKVELEQQALDFFRMAFNSDDKYAQYEAMEWIFYIPKEHWANLIRLALSKKNNYLLRCAIDMIQYVPEVERVDLAREVLSQKEPHFRKEAVKMIRYVPEEEREGLVREALKEDEDIYVQINSIEMIDYLPEVIKQEFKKKAKELLITALSNVDAYVKECAAYNIRYADLGDITALINFAMTLHLHGNFQNIVIKSIQYAPIEDRSHIIKQIMDSDTVYDPATLIDMIHHVPIDERDPLIFQAYKHPNNNFRFCAMKIFGDVLNKTQDKDDKSKNESTIDLNQLAQSTPLYINTKNDFVRSEQAKTGSKTILLGKVPGFAEKSLVNKVIRREFRPAQLIAWIKVYESHELWQKLGFDYVPIEPIIKLSSEKISTKFTKKVFSRVIQGPSYDRWSMETTKFREEIEKQIERIKRGLSEMGIVHGHDHNANFVLYFDRDKDGKPDLNRCPRVYMIDFDRASLTQPEK